MRSNDGTEPENALKLGIFGGTFNPIHCGHLLIAQDAAEAFALSKVLFIPSSIPPHKHLDVLPEGRHRLAMVRLAIRGNPRFEASDIEIRRGDRSYTIDTVRTLQKKYTGADFHLVIGSDSLNEFHHWREAGELARRCHLIAVLRPGEKGFAFRRDRVRRARVLELRAHPFDVSSSEIRERLRSGRSVRYLIPDEVARYIVKHKLYGTQRSR